MTAPYARMIVPSTESFTRATDRTARVRLAGDLLDLYAMTVQGPPPITEEWGNMLLAGGRPWYELPNPAVSETGVSGTADDAPIDATVPVGPTVPDAVSDALSDKGGADG